MIRPAAISTQKTSDGTVLWTTNGYLYDGSGNVRKMGTATFLYDSLSRLTSGTVLPGRLGDGIAQNQSYTFDIYGNITTVTTNGVVRNTPTATATHRLTTAGTTYDAAGNMTAWSGNGYEYDAFNQMTRMVSGAEDWRYIYDANDERLWSYRVGGGGSLWTLRGLNSQVLREYRSHLSWSSYVDSIFRGNALLATAPSSAAGGGVNHLHPDHLGTPRLITNSAGAVAGFHAYYPFGEELAATFNTGYADRQRFTGHERDLANATGQGDDLDYMHARHCSMIVGRFLSVDPVGGNPRSPQTWNRYAYVMGNPLKYVDPEGLFGLGYFDVYAANVGADALEGFGFGFSKDDRSRGIYTDAAGTLYFNGIAFRRQTSPGADFADRLVDRVRGYLQARAEQMAADGEMTAATLDYFALDFLIPEDGADLGMDLAMTFVPGGKLGKSLLKGKGALRQAAKALGIDIGKASKVLHDIKPRAGRGPADNVWINPKSGDVISPETGEIIGNLKD